jgi:hypothetical protein
VMKSICWCFPCIFFGSYFFWWGHWCFLVRGRRVFVIDFLEWVSFLYRWWDEFCSLLDSRGALWGRGWVGWICRWRWGRFRWCVRLGGCWLWGRIRESNFIVIRISRVVVMGSEWEGNKRVFCWFVSWNTLEYIVYGIGEF